MKYVWLLGAVLLVGCSRHPEGLNKDWISVESPPTRVIVLVEKGTMNEQAICKVIRETKRGKYYNYPFNESITITANSDIKASTTNTSSDTKSTALTSN